MQDFQWNIEGEIQTEGQENAGLRWALLGLGQTLGLAGPGVTLLALSFLCMVCLSVVCCVRYVLLPHTGLLPAISFKTYGNKTKLCRFENRGVDLLLNCQIWGHITYEGKYMKRNAGK